MKSFVVLISVLFSFSVWSAQNFGSFAPENFEFVPVDAPEANDMTEELFNQILDQVQEVYAPIFQAKGANLVIERAWSDGTVNAYAFRRGNNWHIKMFGGLARHQLVTPDAFALVACHEIGHHIGGAPKGSWASNEGQSDYFATLKCGRFLWSQQDNIAIVNYYLQWGLDKALRMSDVAKKACAEAHKYIGQNSQALCLRNAMAGQSLGNLLARLGGQALPNFETPDPTVVNRTNNRHPKGQCRLDTYFQGALCPIAKEKDVDPTNPDIGVCARRANATFGIRPLCWYKP